jgi:protease-4
MIMIMISKVTNGQTGIQWGAGKTGMKRFLKGLLKFFGYTILSFVVFFVTLIVLMALTMGPRVGRNSLLVLDMQGAVYEEGPQNWKERLLTGDVLTTRSIITALDKAKKDRRIKALLVTAMAADMGAAKAQEIRAAIKDFAKAKPAYAYAETADTLDYYLCSAAPKVYMPPDGAGGIALLGLRVEATFFKGTFDKLGVEAQMEHVGTYKNYAETYTRENMSDAAREEITSVLGSMYDRITLDIAADRKIPVERLRQIIDRGPALRKDDKENGLVTDLMYKDQVEDIIKKETKAKELDQISVLEYQKPTFSESFDIKENKVAVIYATGAIIPGQSYKGPGEEDLGSATLSENLQDAREDDSIKAVVLRVDSPGGSAIASDVIWREVELTKKKKPVVVSMSDVAASGGYYISMGATKIFADPSTITGSIGVVFGKFVLKGFYDKIGLTKDIVKKGEHADLYSDYVPFDEEELQLVRRQMQTIYDAFTRKAAEGRNKTQQQIDAIGQGRIWTGEQAIGIGLVNQLGGLQDAIAEAIKLAKLSDKTEVSLQVYPSHKKGFSDILYADAPKISLPNQVTELLSLARMTEREHLLLLMPYHFRWE